MPYGFDGEVVFGLIGSGGVAVWSLGEVGRLGCLVREREEVDDAEEGLDLPESNSEEALDLLLSGLENVGELLLPNSDRAGDVVVELVLGDSARIGDLFWGEASVGSLASVRTTMSDR